MKQKKRTPVQQERNNFMKREAARVIREETARLKAKKELQQIKNERRQQPSVMWARLIEESGQEFEDYVSKPAKNYNFKPIEKSF